MADKKLLVFVYGTLKVNQPNHYWLTNSANGRSNLVSNGKTSEQYPLVIGSRFNIPYLLHLPGTGHQINGEIYDINEQMLMKLDELEGHPTYYTRQQITIIDDNGTEHFCWTYFLNNYPDDFLKDRQLISNYKDSIEAPYVKPGDRPKSPKPLNDLAYRS